MVLFPSVNPYISFHFVSMHNSFQGFVLVPFGIYERIVECNVAHSLDEFWGEMLDVMAKV